MLHHDKSCSIMDQSSITLIITIYNMQDSRINDEFLVEDVLREDERRRRAALAPFDPVAGIGSPGSRIAITVPELAPAEILIPVAMTEEPEVKALMAGRSLAQAFTGSVENARRRWFELRCLYDFPFWAFTGTDAVADCCCSPNCICCNERRAVSMTATVAPAVIVSPSATSNDKILPDVSADSVTVVASKIPVAS